MSITTEKAAAILKSVAADIIEKKEFLSELDRAIGDGDHGFNMARGFEAVTAKLEEQKSASLGELFKTTAMTLLSTVGGASGPLYSTLFLKMASIAGNKTELSLAEFVPMFKAGALGVKERGKAEKGEKTMLDVLLPVVEFLEIKAAEGRSGKVAFEGAAKMAQICAESTAPLVATKGRAAYLGERSRGHVDPGAASSSLMIQTIAREL